jgi:hypothetical protein
MSRERSYEFALNPNTPEELERAATYIKTRFDDYESLCLMLGLDPTA